MLRPHVVLASSANLGLMPLVVLDTNAVLDIALHAQRWFAAKFAGHVIVVPPIVLAELATKTHVQAYVRAGTQSETTRQAARASLVQLSRPGSPWPSIDSSTAVVGYPSMKLWSAISRQRQCSEVDCAEDWIRWNGQDSSGRRFSSPAMADHQVLATAWGLERDGHSNTVLLTSDGDLSRAARRFGVAVLGVPREIRRGA
jgi:rRNA-processing protein FCF1